MVHLAFALLFLVGHTAGSKACAQCHAAIYRSFSATPMARSSGAVSDSNAPLAEFDAGGTGTHFRIERSAGGITVHYLQGAIGGERRLNLFVGAGVVGRSYAYDADGFLFQAPVSYYASTGQWDLSPGFQRSDHVNLTRPIENSCFNCHASGLRTVSGTVNGYQTPPFEEGGVSCERCHGNGDAHVRRGAKMVNPAKLNPAERDSICAQCHLVGVIRIAKAGAAPYSPGGRLFDGTEAFLWGTGTHQLSANSHFEQLVQSACWRRSEGKFWCGSCHDPHPIVPTAERAGYFRQRCLTCHTRSAPDCSAPAKQRQAARDDCVSCHMKAKTLATVQHAAQIDHTIPRIPGEQASPVVPDDASLIPFPGSTAGDRELGLAYAGEALPRNNPSWGKRAIPLLESAAEAHPDDAAVSEQLAQLYDRMGRNDDACKLFAKASQQRATGAGALVNLGACQAQQGEFASAVASWTEALVRNPGLEEARLNLAVAQFRLGNTAAARANLQKALEFDPFLQRARELLAAMDEK
jgi:Tetratricopeptide repeat/Cytochrome c554 and c-prime